MKSTVKYLPYIVIVILIFLLIIQRNYYKQEIRKLETEILISRLSKSSQKGQLEEEINQLKEKNRELESQNEELEILLQENDIDY